jgi:tRNA dimethylallyltransferase
MSKNKLIAIVGPTASGKSSLAVWLARQIQKGVCGAEIISADSRQVYKGLDIGTGKVTKKEMQGVPHHLLSVASPKPQFSVDDFVKQAEHAIDLIYQVKHVPIVVGGTGLYVDMFVGRMSYAGVPPNPALRKKLGNKTPAQLFAMLKKVDPARAATIEKDNPRRLVRALEIARALGKSPIPNPNSKYDVLWLGLSPTPAKLKINIRKRLVMRMRAGMIAEAKRLRRQGLSYKRMYELGLEYRYLALFLQGKLSQKEFEEQLERAIYHYAKRQMRWFKRNKDINWISSKTEALKLAKNFLRTQVKLPRQ